MREAAAAVAFLECVACGESQYTDSTQGLELARQNLPLRDSANDLVLAYLLLMKFVYTDTKEQRNWCERHGLRYRGMSRAEDLYRKLLEGPFNTTPWLISV